MRKPLGAVLIGLTLLGASCGSGIPQKVSYVEPTSGLTFEYPPHWGDVVVSHEVAGMDTGKRVTVGFSKHLDFSLTAASADYSEGVGEGTSNYFTLKDDVDISTPESVTVALEQRFTIVSLKRFADGIYRMDHNAEVYGGSSPRKISYLFTDWSAHGFATVMVTSSADANNFPNPDVEVLVRSIR